MAVVDIVLIVVLLLLGVGLLFGFKQDDHAALYAQHDEVDRVIRSRGEPPPSGEGGSR
ncbi:MAG TPA: hypothetical protein VFN55_07820 [Solirubrobacteraceae bacterium]|nr:hypothetical protein [Solirubrobacteraceae bacterium]